MVYNMIYEVTLYIAFISGWVLLMNSNDQTNNSNSEFSNIDVNEYETIL